MKIERFEDIDEQTPKVYRLKTTGKFGSIALAVVSSLVWVGRGWAQSPAAVTCLGDSATHGYPYADNGNPELAYPARLQGLLDAAYGEGSFQVFNRGVNGYKAENVVGDLLQPDALAENPVYVLLMIGGNDLAGANIYTIAQIIAETTWEVQSCVNLVRGHLNPDGSRPKVIVSAFIPNLLEGTLGSLAVNAYNGSLANNLSGHDLWFTANWDDFYDPATGTAKTGLMSDSVHPNSDGYAAMAQNWHDALAVFAPSPTPAPTPSAAFTPSPSPPAGADDLVFIHHSCGNNWLADGLDAALLAKDSIDERNDIYYGTDFAPDTGRPDSLGSVPGDNTNMDHWVRWFNDYLDRVKGHGCASGFNRIVMFKSCYPISNVASDGTEPGSPFSSTQTIANYQAVYRKYGDPGGMYSYDGYYYRPLEDVFAAHPEVLFIPVTAPPRHYAPSDATSNDEAHRARLFNDWLKGEWLSSYHAAHPGLNNVAVFDWFDFLSYSDSDPTHPNRLRAEYGGTGGDSHPNAAANQASTAAFASATGNFIDDAFLAWQTETPTPAPAPSTTPAPSRTAAPSPTRSVSPTPSPVPTAFPPWPGSSGTSIGGGLGAVYEPSGLEWNGRAGRLFVVGDGGQVSWMDESGGQIVTRSPGGDLEGIAIANPASPFVYLGVENPDSIIEFNYQSGALTGRSWSLTPWMTGEPNQGLEALAFVPNGHHPYADSSSGGLFYAGLQQDGKIYVFDVDVAVGGAVSHVATITPYPGLTDLSGLDYRPETGVLYAVFDTFDLLLEMAPDGTVLRGYTLPAGTQEGIAVKPACPSGAAVVFIAHDSPGDIVRYAAYPVSCLPTPPPSPTSTPRPSPSATPSPRRTPSPSPPPPSATPSPSVTATPSAVPSKTPTPIPTVTPTAPTPLTTPSLTTPSPTSTATPRPSPSPTPTCGPLLPPYKTVVASGDYDGDGAANICIFRPSSNMWSIRDLTRFYYGLSTDVPAAGDYDGDGTADGALFRPSSGQWLVSGLTRMYYGTIGDIPAPADYNGDGSADIASFRGATGCWSVRGLTRRYFGAQGDWTLPCDYNGDGTQDMAIFRPGVSLWAVPDVTRFYFGASSDWPLSLDLDGDGSFDVGIFRPCSGMWAIRNLTRFFIGSCTDWPRPADYDGDGSQEPGIFRDSDGLWMVKDLTRVYFGSTGDIPATR